MIFIDTHTHLYLPQFDDDRTETVERALSHGVKAMLLPNIDIDSLGPMYNMCESFPNSCFPMLGLHPTSVKENFREVLGILEKHTKERRFYAIGETGIDLYWDKTFFEQQQEALRIQVGWARKYDLPLVIHSREALEEIIAVLKETDLPQVRGVFHCYPGDAKTAVEIVEMGYYIGIGGVVTYPKTQLPEVVRAVGLEHIILETDAPYLPPVPYRGKRNESSYIPIIAEKLASLSGFSLADVAQITTQNALDLFKFNTV